MFGRENIRQGLGSPSGAPADMAGAGGPPGMPPMGGGFPGAGEMGVPGPPGLPPGMAMDPAGGAQAGAPMDPEMLMMFLQYLLSQGGGMGGMMGGGDPSAGGMPPADMGMM